jgi:hypothetical protein
MHVSIHYTRVPGTSNATQQNKWEKQQPEQGRGDEFLKSPYNSFLNLILYASCPFFPTALHGVKQMKA